MNKSRWNRSRTYRQSKSLKQAYRIGDLVVYHWTKNSHDDELCVVVDLEPESEGVIVVQPVSGECAYPATTNRITHVE